MATKRNLSRIPVILADANRVIDSVQENRVPLELFVNPDNNDLVYINNGKEIINLSQLLHIEIDKVADQVLGLIWKAAVETASMITTVYPEPEEGWAVYALEEGYAYRFTTTADYDSPLTIKVDTGYWVVISSNFIPLASATRDGRLTSEGFVRLNEVTKVAMVTSADNEYIIANRKLNNLYDVVVAESSTIVVGEDGKTVRG